MILILMMCCCLLSLVIAGAYFYKNRGEFTAEITPMNLIETYNPAEASGRSGAVNADDYTALSKNVDILSNEFLYGSIFNSLIIFLLQDFLVVDTIQVDYRHLHHSRDMNLFYMYHN